MGVNTDRGYTMHEHLDEMGVIHMNGRIYDPLIGRFMSADPFVPDANNLQAYNRYAYVLNNPLAYTDPSGFKPFWKKKWFKIGLGIAIGWWTGGAVMNAILPASLGAPSLGLAAIGGAAGGFAAGAITSGDLKGALHGAFSGALFGAAGLAGGGGVEGANSLARYAAHAAAGCISASAGGGSCGNGMISAVFGKFTSNNINLGDTIANGVATSIAGGVGSVIAGGKFENGATTAAFGYLFNHMSLLTRGAQAAQSVWGRIQSFFGSPIGQTLTETASGEVNGLSSSGAARVGRWMSEVEYKQMSDTGRVVESQLRVTNVAFPANSSAYTADTAGKLYVEFNVPRDALHFVDTSNGWAKIHGPSSPFATRLGVTQMPSASEIQIVNPLVQQIPR